MLDYNHTDPPHLKIQRLLPCGHAVIPGLFHHDFSGFFTANRI
jgi:hypothetical protein